MKKLILALVVMALASCEKEQAGTGTATFYTKDPHNWSLIIDGKEYGRITNCNQMPVCGDQDFQVITLSAGQHEADARSLDGYAWGSPKTFTVKADDCVQVSLP